MYKINKAFAKPLHLDTLKQEIDELTIVIEEIMNPSQLFLFGSAISGPFYEDSDFDLLLIFKTAVEAKASWRKFPHIRRVSKRSLDMISMSEDDFAKKKEIEGIAMIAKNEGRRLI